MNDSQFPWIADTSRPVEFMTCCINGDFPRVPTIIGREVREKLELKGKDTFVIDVSTPVTRRISAAKSAAANWTPGHSLADISMGAAFLLFTMEKELTDDWRETQVIWPIPRVPRSKVKKPRTKRKVRVIFRDPKVCAQVKSRLGGERNWTIMLRPVCERVARAAEL